MDIINCQYTYVTFSLFSSTTSIKKVNEIDFLFLSERCEHNSNRTIEYMLEKELNHVGFDKKIFST